MKQLTHGSLFDGAGGLRLGFEQAGFSTRWALDYLNGHDVRTAKPEQFERVDVISGGPPCQRGSVIGNFNNTRTYHTLWPEMLRFIQALLPNWVVLENVPGFQRQMVDWTADLYELGYGCAGQAIDSRHWVPQQRTRCFVVGRLGAEGMALWHHLYAPSLGGSRATKASDSGEANSGRSGRPTTKTRDLLFRPCAECLRDGISTGLSAWKFALMGAGNAVTVPVARFIAERIEAYP